jgi:hypothetical protein
MDEKIEMSEVGKQCIRNYSIATYLDLYFFLFTYPRKWQLKGSNNEHFLRKSARRLDQALVFPPKAQRENKGKEIDPLRGLSRVQNRFSLRFEEMPNERNRGNC